ncbi:hypothetical protein [Chitinophaga agri]|uniref:Lipoprotein n=1 Tax=Chitinophaga agri TaxID=2703787 RepID=A0A6B9ZQ12_9BACT|nr:hypothetical protein [Chitinophaga agri]QHS62793.1 hypothetical protein GWR21_25395 [Chitinophaga agri]
MKAWSLLLITTLFFACDPSPKNAASADENDKTSAGEAFKPAEPAGKLSVSFPVTDTTEIKLVFEMDGKTKEKTFELPLAKEVPEKDLFRLVWDKPNSCYIGVLKQNRDTRYYHASVDEKGYPQIFHVGTPPAEVWQYAENKLGLGKISSATAAQIVQSYKQNFQSGKIIADFIVQVKPGASDAAVEIYAEFGGANRTLPLAVPAGSKAGLLLQKGRPEQCFVVLETDGKLSNTYEIKVENGRLQINTLTR